MERDVRGGEDIDLETKGRQDDLAFALINKMKQAANLDKISFENKQPCLRKLMMLKEVQEEIRKVNFQESFFDSDGCDVLADWIDVLPDGTFPNFTLVNGILNTLLNLKIESKSLEESRLVNVVQNYECGASKNLEL